MTLFKSNNLFQQTSWPSIHHIVIAKIRETSVERMCWANETAVEDHEPVMIELYNCNNQRGRNPTKVLLNRN